MMDGSSMAAPHITALAALLMQAKSDATAAQVEAAIYASCTRRDGMDTERVNRGFPDAVEALATLTGIRLGGARAKVSVTRTKNTQKRQKQRTVLTKKVARTRRKR